MKTKAVAAFLAVFMLGGCVEQGPKERKKIVSKGVEYVFDESETTLQVWEIDGCEYLYGPWGASTVLTHKGDCRNHKK